jgi:hypothetical protein
VDAIAVAVLFRDSVMEKNRESKTRGRIAWRSSPEFLAGERILQIQPDRKQ